MKQLLIIISLTLMIMGDASANGFSDLISSDAEVQNLIDTIENLALAEATPLKKTVVSSNMAAILYSSDKLICGIWIIQMESVYKKLVIEGADLRLINYVIKLRDRLQMHCLKIFDGGLIEEKDFTDSDEKVIQENEEQVCSNPESEEDSEPVKTLTEREQAKAIFNSVELTCAQKLLKLIQLKFQIEEKITMTKYRIAIVEKLQEAKLCSAYDSHTRILETETELTELGSVKNLINRYIAKLKDSCRA